MRRTNLLSPTATPMDFGGLGSDVKQVVLSFKPATPSQANDPNAYANANDVWRGITENNQGQTLLIPDVTVSEQHGDSLQITDHPVEQGTSAYVSDHAYKLPAQVTLEYGFSPSGFGNDGQSPTYLLDTYQKLLGLQTSRKLVSVFTGKRTYNNMLVQSLSVTTDKETENALLIRVECREVLIATTKVVSVSLQPINQANAQKTQEKISTGPQQPQSGQNANQPDLQRIIDSSNTDLVPVF